jgi:GNAT superfamily N-acetyltransferase
MSFAIRQMEESDIDGSTKTFSRLNKRREQFEMFWKEHQEGKRVTFVAVSGEEIVGYTNLLWQSDYIPFQEMGIPEINNMHVLDGFQKQGIGTALIQAAECVAAAQDKEEIGIGFGLTSDYGQAQRLYPKLGYIPDGRGAQLTPWGDVLYLTRRLI